MRHRKRASPPTVIASERKMMPEKRRLMHKASRSRSPTPTSMLPDEPSAPQTTEDIATAGKVVVGLMNPPAKEEDEDEANKEPHIKSTKNQSAVLGELMDTAAAAEATGSLDKMTGWPEGGIASAGNIVDNMSECVRARLKWCPRS